MNFYYLAFNDGATMQVVAGRFVNAYSSNDWTLGVTFRARYVLSIGDILSLTSNCCIFEKFLSPHHTKFHNNSRIEKRMLVKTCDRDR